MINREVRCKRRWMALCTLVAAFACESCEKSSGDAKPYGTASEPSIATPVITATPRPTNKATKMSPTTSKEMMAKADGVEVKATFHSRPDRFEVEFAVTNNSPASIYLIDFDFDSNGGGSSLRLDRLQSQYEAPGTAVLVSRLFPLLPGVTWMQPPSTYGTKVAAGSTYRSALSATVPLRAKGAVLPTADVECSRIRFELGVIPESPDLNPKAMTIPGKYRLSTPAWQHQKVLAVETDELTVPMVTR